MKSLLQLHRSMLTLRRAEELLARLYKENPQPIRTPMHLSAGQEAVSVGVCAALNLPHDVIFSHHRSHAAYLASGAPFFGLAAELFGSEKGCSRGRGGSVHLTNKSTGLIATSAILGEMMAVATGASLAFKLRKEPHVAVSFFGDGSLEEGIAYESFSYAALNKLPVLFIMEQNSYSTESPLNKRYPANTSFCDRAFSFGIAVKKIDGNNVSEVYETAKNAIELVRGGQPCFIECDTYRLYEHVGPHTDMEMGRTYRTETEWNEWQTKDPIKRNTAAILEAGLATQDELTLMDLEISVGLEADAHCARLAELSHGLLENT